MKEGLERLRQNILEDMRDKLPWQRKTQSNNLSEAIATILHLRTVNTSEIAAALPRKAERMDMRYQWLLRLLDNPHIDPQTIMSAYGKEILSKLLIKEEQVVLMLDQTHINKTFEMLMVSVRFNNRALPLVWAIKATQGPIGFAEQKQLLDSVHQWLPSGCKIVLMGDRAYGTPDLIQWCQSHSFDYRLRLKGNTKTYQGLQSVPACSLQPGNYLNVPITHKGVHTNLGIIHEEGHEEPWIVAMSTDASEYKTLDYGMRWGIEAMFSDFKTRGFALESSHMKKQDHLDRLVLMLAIALYWAVSTGYWASLNENRFLQKKHLGKKMP